MMIKQRLKMVTAIVMMLIIMAPLSACGKTSGAEEASEYLKLVYECYETGNFALVENDGTEVETRSRCFIFENTSDQDIRSAKVSIHGLDENGEKLVCSYNLNNIGLPDLKQGERAIISCMDAEWKETPASFMAEPTGIVWGESKGAPLTILDATCIGQGFTWEVTLRNDGDEDFLWVNDLEDVEGSPGRRPVLIAVTKDEEGNTDLERGVLLNGDDFMHDNFTIAPGEEKTLEVCFSEAYQDPEIIVCWIR